MLARSVPPRYIPVSHSSGQASLPTALLHKFNTRYSDQGATQKTRGIHAKGKGIPAIRPYHPLHRLSAGMVRMYQEFS